MNTEQSLQVLKSVIDAAIAAGLFKTCDQVLQATTALQTLAKELTPGS